MLTYRVGASASPAAGLAMAKYLTTETLKPEHEALARYYAGETPPLPTSLLEELAQGLNRGDVGYGEALDELVRAEIALIPRGQAFDIDEIEVRLGLDLVGAATRDLTQEVGTHGGTVAELRPDLSPALAERLGITDPTRPLTETGIAHLLNGRRLDGDEIAGKHVQKATLSVAEVFGLDPKLPLVGDAMRNVLEGRRADGDLPKRANGQDLEPGVIAGAQKRFRAALGVPTHRDATTDEIAHLLAGRTATGGMVDAGHYRRQIHATRPPVGFVDLTFSADKSLSAAWALAPTESERAALLDIHKHAVADAMAHVEERIGFARMGHGGQSGAEAGKIGWVVFQHYTARPAVDIVRTDVEGRAYTDPREVPTQTADPQLHTHATVFNAVLVSGTGRLGSLDLDRLDGFVKEGGAVYQAAVATRARRAGIDVILDDKTGAARLADVPSSVREMFSKRSQEALVAARVLAKSRGQDWDTLSGDQQVALIKAGANETRQSKGKRSPAEDGKSDFAVWREQAEAAGYHHRSVLRLDEIKPELTPEQRHAMAYEVSQPLIEREFGQRAKLEGQDLRVMAARSLIASGIGDKPGEDIAAVLKAYARHGIRQDGTQTSITMGKEAPVRGKDRWSVTTALHENQERELISLARAAAADKSAALSVQQIDRAADAFLARNPGIDPAGAHWKKQRDMMTRLGSGGAVGIAIGAAGAGKSTVIAPLVDAWKADARKVFGATVAWRQSGDLGAAGIDANNRAALDPFLKRVGSGKYALDRNSVVVVDEVGLVGTRQQLELMRLRQKYGFTLVQFGDEKQCASVAAGPVIDLMREALGKDQVPEILTSIRQKTAREVEITDLFRNGKAALALEMKQQDGTALLAAGGWPATVQHVARLWFERTEANKADPAYKLSVSAETNAAAHDIGLAIRARRREAGQLVGPDVEISAIRRGAGAEKLALAMGDRVRLFDRVHDAETPGRTKVLASNGDAVEVCEIADKGMRVRNADGVEGLIAWSKIRERAGGPIRLAYGYAATVNVSQGMTSAEHIHASVSSHGLTGYTAMSRHQHVSWLVVDEASVRRRIHLQNAKSGDVKTIGISDVWNRLGEEMSRQPMKASALDILSRVTEVRRGSVAKFQRSMAVAERIQGMPGVHLNSYERARLAVAPVMRQAVEYAYSVKQRMTQGQRPNPGQQPGIHRQAPGRGPRLGL